MAAISACSAAINIFQRPSLSSIERSAAATAGIFLVGEEVPFRATAVGETDAMEGQALATLVAAVIAAGLSLATLIATVLLERSRQRAAKEAATTMWMRQALHEAVYEFTCGLFDVSSSSKRTRRSGSWLTRRKNVVHLRAAHERLRHSQTLIRLLGTERLITAAEGAHDAHDNLMELAQRRPASDEESWQALTTVARSSRERFIEEARQPLGLKVYPVRIRQPGQPYDADVGGHAKLPGV